MSRSPLWQVRVLLVAALSFFAPLTPLIAVDFDVNTELDIRDHNPGDGGCAIPPGIKICSLRAAIQEANALPGSDTINLPGGHYSLTLAGSGEDAAATGDLDVTEYLTIEGRGADETVVDGVGIDRVFHVSGTGVALALENLTVTGGVALDSSGPPAGVGGGVLAESGASLGLFRVRVADNRALIGGGAGGWIAQRFEITASEVTRNEIQVAPGYSSAGGGFYFNNPFSPTAGVVVVGSTISKNGCLTQTASECSGGVSVIRSDGEFVVINSTVSGNEGRGISLGQSPGAITSSTLFGNTGYGLVLDSAVAVEARNSIFANNAIQDCELSGGLWLGVSDHNLSSDASCGFSPASGDQVNTDPELYPLGAYSPPNPHITHSHHPRWAAPVVDSGLPTAWAWDQDGYGRGGDGNADGLDGYDLGSIEVLPCLTVVDWVIKHETLTSGAREACNTLTADPDVTINGTVSFWARDSVVIGNDFEVTAGSVFSAGITRDAGAP